MSEIYQGQKLRKEEKAFLLELEKINGQPIPSIGKIRDGIYGFIAKKGNIIGIKHFDKSSKTIPNSITNLSSLKHLSLRYLSLEKLPEFIYELENLEILDLSCCINLKFLPEGIKKLESLRELHLEGCVSLKSLPDDIGSLKSLQKIILRRCQSLDSLPSSIIKLSSLKELDIAGCEFNKSIPRELYSFAEVKYYSDSYHGLQMLKEEHDILVKLESQINEAIPRIKKINENSFGFVFSKGNIVGLSLNNKNINDISKIGELKLLSILVLNSCKSLKSLTQDISKLELLETLNLDHCDFILDISNLIGLRNLKLLNLEGIPISLEEIEKLKETLPELKLKTSKLHPSIIFNDFLKNKLSKKETAEFLIDLLDNYQKFEIISLKCIETLEKLDYGSEPVFLSLENFSISDNSSFVRAAAFKVLSKLFPIKCLKALNFAIQNEKSLLVLNTIFNVIENAEKEKLKFLKEDFLKILEKIYDVIREDALSLFNFELNYAMIKDGNWSTIYEHHARIIEMKIGSIKNNITISNSRVIDINISGMDLKRVPDGFKIVKQIKSLKYINEGVNKDEVEVLVLLEILSGLQFKKITAKFNGELSVYKINEKGNIIGIYIHPNIRFGNIRSYPHFELPEKICSLKHLEELHLWGCGITKIPDCIVNLSSIKILDLNLNKIREISESIIKLKNLEDIRIGLDESKTDFKKLPFSIQKYLTAIYNRRKVKINETEKDIIRYIRETRNNTKLNNADKLKLLFNNISNIVQDDKAILRFNSEGATITGIDPSRRLAFNLEMNNDIFNVFKCNLKRKKKKLRIPLNSLFFKEVNEFLEKYRNLVIEVESIDDLSDNLQIKIIDSTDKNIEEKIIRITHEDLFDINREEITYDNILEKEFSTEISLKPKILPNFFYRNDLRYGIIILESIPNEGLRIKINAIKCEFAKSGKNQCYWNCSDCDYEIRKRLDYKIGINDTITSRIDEMKIVRFSVHESFLQIISHLTLKLKISINRLIKFKFYLKNGMKMIYYIAPLVDAADL